MKRVLVLAALVGIAAGSAVAPPPAPVTPEPVAQCTSCHPTSAAPAAALASVPEVVDDPCLPGDPCAPAATPAPIPEAPAPAAGDRPAPAPVHPAAVGQDAGGALPPAGPVTVAAPPAPPVDASGCRPDEDVDPDSPTGCITRQLPGETTGRAYG